MNNDLLIAAQAGSDAVDAYLEVTSANEVIRCVLELADAADTIRQKAVLMAMQGILANPNWHNTSPLDVAIDAAEYADAVLRRELETRGRSHE